jgi:hypothetical protein
VIALHVNGLNATADTQVGSSRDGSAGQTAVKTGTVNHRRANAATLQMHGLPCGAPEPHALGTGKDQGPGKVELLKGIVAKKTGAMNGLPDDRVLFEHQYVVPEARETLGGRGPGGPGAYDDNVMHVCTVRTSSLGIPKCLGK